MNTAPLPPTAQKTILLVEDEFDTVELLSRALQRAGHACLAARSAQEAAVLARRAAGIDLVVTDVVLGEDRLGGLTLLGSLRQEGVRAPVVIITAFADVEKLKIALNEGAAYFLEKPFRAPALLEVVERLLVGGPSARHPIEGVLARAQLTEKELTVARLLLEGLSSSEIAAREHNSPRTIRQHVTQIYFKCGVASRAQFFRLAYLK